MNRVNPLQIALLLVVVIAFLLFKLTSLKEELLEATESYKTSEKLAIDLNSLKSVYVNPKKTKKAINRILSQRSLRGANLEIKREKKSIKITTESIDTAALNSLMGKVLNGSYNITLLKIKRLSETKASLVLEIKW